jgi:hypothetical protein
MAASPMRNPLFDTVPQKDYFELFKDGRPDAKRVVNFLKYRNEDVSVAANVPMSSVRYDGKMPEDLIERLREWATAINLVGTFFKDEQKTMLWFQMPNPMLGNLSPKEMIRMGRFKKLLKFIQTALDENIGRGA